MQGLVRLGSCPPESNICHGDAWQLPRAPESRVQQTLGGMVERFSKRYWCQVAFCLHLQRSSKGDDRGFWSVLLYVRREHRVSGGKQPSSTSMTANHIFLTVPALESQPLQPGPSSILWNSLLPKPLSPGHGLLDCMIPSGARKEGEGWAVIG